MLRCGDLAGDEVVEEVSGADGAKGSIDASGSGLVGQLDDVGGAIVELAAIGCGTFFWRQYSAGGDAPGVVAHEDKGGVVPGSVVLEFLAHMRQIFVAEGEVVEIGLVCSGEGGGSAVVDARHVGYRHV